MKKLALYLAGIMTAIAFAPEASALPLFARQTGMACSACHFQHFPMLNAFGRAFKASGFTMMGEQGKVEGDNLSMPNTLNMAVLATAGYTKTNADGAAATAGTVPGERYPGDGTFYVPGTNGEFSLFVGGRASDNVGALAELGMLQDAGRGAGLSSAKLPMLWEVADGTRAGLVPFTTGGQGASYGFEELNTGANAVHTMLFIGGDFNESVAPVLSAQQYIGTGAQATGAAFVVNNPGYFINLTKFNGVGPADLGGNSAALTSTYLRLAGTFDLAGWDTGIGIQSWSGSSVVVGFSDIVTAGVATETPFATLSDTKATAIDGQMQGALGNMPVGFYVTYARAPSNTANGNAFNAGTDTRSSFNLAAELGVIPEKATVGIAIRRGKSGMAVGAATNATDNAWLIEGSYKLAQNILLNLIYTSQSGDFWDAGTIAGTGSKQTTINLATIF
ncbi:MAG: hypothetical protein ABI479_04225 [Gallionella sp.]